MYIIKVVQFDVLKLNSGKELSNAILRLKNLPIFQQLTYL
jgi:hypothetical protein